MWHRKLIAIILSLLWPMAACADTLTIPNSFTPSTAAQSSQVNANFTAISSLINGNISDTNIKSAAAIDPTKLDLTQAIPILRATGNTCFGAGNTGDTQYRCVMTSDGYLQLGVGSSTAPDIMIKRESGPVVAIRNSADSAYADLKAAALTLSGALSGTTGTFSGNVTGVNGSFSGPVTGTTATFSDDLAAVDGTFSGNVSGVGGAFSGAVSGTTGTFSGALQAPSLTLTTTPLAATSGGTGLSSYGSALQQLRMNSGGTALEYFTPSNAGVFKASAITATLRDPGTGGSISGDYVYNGNITTGSSWTMASGTRLYIKGNLTVGHAITVSNLGNGAPWTADGGVGVAGGVGPGSGGNATADPGGGGAGYGDGGNAQAVNYGAPGGQTGGLSAVMLGGSGGGRSYYGAGAAGGGAVYIEVDGDVTLNEGISAVGADSSAVSAYSGGGGGGGTVVIRCTGDYTIASTKAINVSGGAAAAAASGRGGGGGGGYIEVWCGGTATVTGSHTVSGGAGSSSGSSGLATVISGADPISWF